MKPSMAAAVMIAAVFPFTSADSQTTDQLLDTLQHTAFNFFWYEANPANGLIKDRSAAGAPCSIASVGFGLTAITIGIEHGWVSRAAARDRVLTTLNTFWVGPQGSEATGKIGYKGFFYHFLDMTSATRTWTSELSTIDTGLLLAGILSAKQYFSADDSVETRIRALADSIYRRMDWEWFRNFNPGILMGWMPGTQFGGYGQWVGYNEASIMYILALGSPSYPISYTGWQKWTQGYSWQSWYGHSYVNFPPLFGHQYSHCWIDFRNIADEYMRNKGITYFENSRRATLAQRAYCRANPGGFVGYSDSLWGITASDVPPVLHGGNTYMARGAPPAQDDDGTITPTAPISSLPFAPDSVLPTIRTMWDNYRAQLWTPYGFRDAFNPTVNWWGSDVIGIDQGPIIIMIENYRTGKVWDSFMKNEDVQRGLQRAGFLPIPDEVRRTDEVPDGFALLQNYPNPFNPSTTIRYTIPTNSNVKIRVFDVLGREVMTLVDGPKSPGHYSLSVNAGNLASGVYTYTLESGASTLTRKFLLLK
jgi:hypothetical protein